MRGCRAHASPAPDDVRLIPVEGEGAKYWSRWRGPSGQGHVAGTNYTDTWSSTERVTWRVRVPGVGHSSPIVWRDHLFLTTATPDGARVSLLAFDRASGKLLWETPVPSRGVEHVYPKNSRASATPVTDGVRVYASFGTHGLAAFDFSGKIVWQAKLGDVYNYHGSAGSPVLYKDRVFIFQDHDGSATIRSFVAAFDAASGKLIWKRDRFATVGWGTPIVIQTGTRDELIVSSQGTVRATTRQPAPTCGWCAGTPARSSRPRSSATVWCSVPRAGPARHSPSRPAAAATSPGRTSSGPHRAGRLSCRPAWCTATCCIS